eukprot:TRINITY_DN12921_c0_g1_i1.p3 TRINITY_DN12921_c0_g1~~TRINITY_DN12921_c0_g1_i1.p3  ORF type:complete len:64 (-),score=9.51 TRINITY_DN12921_c0_g1_i1:185-376(-)
MIVLLEKGVFGLAVAAHISYRIASELFIIFENYTPHEHQTVDFGHQKCSADDLDTYAYRHTKM